MKHIQAVLDIHITVCGKKSQNFIHPGQLLLLIFQKLIHLLVLLLCLNQLNGKGIFADKRHPEYLWLDGACHPVLVAHTALCNGNGVLFQVLVTLAHLHFSQDHVAVLAGILILGSYNGSQSSCRSSIIIFQISGIDQTHAVDLFLLAKAVIDSKCNVEILRLHKHIKTLCIQISFYCISPFFILDFQHFAENSRLDFPSQAGKFLLYSFCKEFYS